ncbi:MAG TPA: hypothetical protein VFK60_04620 [Casimicrobiaceae bacterium]|nr:hypothetical protein [Casimicrobiaceae bacterium]
MVDARRQWVVALATWFMFGGLAAPNAAAQLRALPPMASWPNTMTLHGSTVTVSEPQAIAWPEHRTLTARAAVSILRPGARVPIRGTVEVSANTETDYTTRTVTYSGMKLVSTKFPSLDAVQAAQVEAQMRDVIPALGAKRVPVDAVLLSLKEPPAPPQTIALANDPPTIFYSTRPASLVVFNGEPVMAPLADGLSVAVNTNWSVFETAAGHSWYLLANGTWFSAPAAAGPWAPTHSLPPVFKTLPRDPAFDDVRKAMPPRPVRAASAPTIIVSMKPAEIIVTSGAPKLAALAGTALQYVVNTPVDLFFMPSTGRFYFLTSGRWFSAAALEGPWTFATPSLPPDFARIPASSPKGHVLVSVPGTPQAQQAVMEAQVPRQGTIERSTVKVAVTYAGPPKFVPIAGTTMTYAVNTSYQVIDVAGRYYVCYNAAWFVAPSPNGPWVLADAVPQVIYTISPASPLYNVTYVTVYSSTPTTVTYGYTTGYTLGYVSAGVVVYGTGYYYPPYYYPAPVPVFIPYPYSYSGATWYNPSTGAWARGGTIYGPYNTASGARYYNPSTGAWAQGGAIYGPNGGAGAFSYYNPTTGTYAHGSASWGADGGSGYANFSNSKTGRSGSTQQNWNEYERWGSSTITGPNQTVNTKSGANAQGKAGGFSSSTGAEGAGAKGANGNKGGAVKTAGGDTYAGADGNVYKHTDSGWSKWNDGSWQPVTPPSNATHPANGQGQTGSGTQGQGQHAQGQGQHAQSANAPMRTQGGTQKQPSSAAAPATSQPGAAPRRLGQGGSAQPAPARGSAEGGAPWDQLEQDRHARTEGAQRQQSYRSQRGGGGLRLR